MMSPSRTTNSIAHNLCFFLLICCLPSSIAYSAVAGRKAYAHGKPAPLPTDAHADLCNSAPAPTGTAISNHGGFVQTQPLAVYLLWFAPSGASWDSVTQRDVAAFVGTLQGSSWWATTQQYTSASGANVTGAVTLGAVVNVPPSAAGSTWAVDAYRNLPDTAVWGVVHYAMANNLVAVDPDGLYFVLTEGVSANQLTVSSTTGQISGYLGAWPVPS